MNAGTMLGLLAGVGALNALGGGKDGKRFKNIVDMFDGGGAGQSGDKFEGGGLLSALGNLFAKPIEAQDRVEQIAARTAMRNAPVAPAAQLSSLLDTKGMTPVTSDPRGFAPNTEPTFSAGSQYNPAPSYANMPMGEVGRGAMPAIQPSTPPTMTAPASGVAPSMGMPSDPMIGGTQTPSAYPPMPPAIEPRPMVNSASPLMSFDEYAPYITQKFQMEYGTNQSISPEKLQQAYAVYRQSMGM